VPGTAVLSSSVPPIASRLRFFAVGFRVARVLNPEQAAFDEIVEH